MSDARYRISNWWYIINKALHLYVLFVRYPYYQYQHFLSTCILAGRVYKPLRWVMLIFQYDVSKELGPVIAFILLYCFHFFLLHFRHVGTLFSSKITLVGVLTKVINESLQIVTFDSLKEASWCTDCNAKNRTHFNRSFLKKWDLSIQKDQTNWTLFTVFSRLFQKWYITHG